MLRETPPEGYAGCCEAISGADLGERLGDIRASTLIIAGAEDPAAPPEGSESIRDSVPDARLEILSPAAHLANVERPEAMTGAILEHLQAAPREEA
jgi:3-oxoadipate enol-lactonase